MSEEKKFNRDNNPQFFKLWDIMCVKKWKEEDRNKISWNDYEIYAKTTKDFTMSVWNGSHEPSVKLNTKYHFCKAGTKVRVWMVSRMGDAGITDNLINPKGYDVRGVDADTDLNDYEFILKK